MSFLQICLLFLINFGFKRCSSYSFNTSVYYRMPPIYRFEDYENCIGIYEKDAIYCVVNTFVKPDSESELYKRILEFSKNKKQHFRHDKLTRGLCMNICQRNLKRSARAEKYFVEKFPMDSKLIFESVEYHNAELHREVYGDDANMCVNYDLMTKYNLSGYSEIEYCIKLDSRPPLDWLDYTTAGVFAALAVLVLISSFYDRILRNTGSRRASDDHYKTSPKLKIHQIFTLFSARRNWMILSAPTKPEVRDLRFIQAIRGLTMLGVVIGHVGWFTIQLPAYNPIFIEDIYSNLPTMLIVNGANIVQSFFVIGGFLTSYLLMVHLQTEKSPTWILFIKAFAIRYLRLAPLLLLTTMMHSSWLYRAGSGPFWDKVNFSERQFCRKNWWTNMLFIDNYVGVEEKCLVHTWYLAADFWLSILATVIILVIYRRPTLKLCAFRVTLGIAFMTTAAVTYFNGFEPITMFTPEALRNQYLRANDDDLNYFADYYAPTHMNIGNYFIGVAVGFMYYHLKKNNVNVSKLLWFRMLWYSCVVVGFLSIFVAFVFYSNDFETPSVWQALLSIVLKHLWGLVLAVGLIGFIYRYGWFWPNIFNYGAWRIIGRISYSTFLCHLFILKLLMSSSHQPLYLSVYSVMAYVSAVFGMSVIFGFMLTVAIEIPVSSICKMLLERSSNVTKDEIQLNGTTRNCQY